MSQESIVPSFNMGNNPYLLFPQAKQELNDYLTTLVTLEGNLFQLGYGMSQKAWVATNKAKHIRRHPETPFDPTNITHLPTKPSDYFPSIDPITSDTAEYERVMYPMRVKQQATNIQMLAKARAFLLQLMGPSVRAEIHNSVIDVFSDGINDLSFGELIDKFETYSLMDKEARAAADIALQHQLHDGTEFISHMNKMSIIFKQFDDVNQSKSEDLKLDILAKTIEYLPNHISAFNTWKILLLDEDQRNFNVAVKYIRTQAPNHVSTVASAQYALAATAPPNPPSVSSGTKPIAPAEPSININGKTHYFCFCHESVKAGTGWGNPFTTHKTSECKLMIKAFAAFKASK
jgi:hypothetical protein